MKLPKLGLGFFASLIISFLLVMVAKRVDLSEYPPFKQSQSTVRVRAEITGKRIETVEEGVFYTQGAHYAVTIITDRKTKRDYMAIPGVGIVLLAQ